MDDCKLTNFFIPSSGSKMIIEKVNNLSPKICHPPLDNDVQMHNYSIPVGISDACILNSNYKKLLLELNILSYDKSDALSMIEKELNKESKAFEIREQYLKDEDQENIEPTMSDYDSQILKTKAIYLWRSTKLSIKKIALKLKTDHEFVKRSIHEYKKAVRNQLKINKLKAASNKLAISPEKIEEIKVFWKENNGKMIRTQDVRAGVWKANENDRIPWSTTISLVMKKKLRMSYKVLSTQHPKVASENHKNLYCESILIQFLLMNDSLELIYVDEFSISGRN